MPPLNLDDNQARYQIRGYKPGYIQINDQVFEHSLIVSKDQLITDWKPQTISDLNEDSFLVTADLKPAIVLIGTGSKHEILKPKLYGKLINLGIGVEVMDTSAACRTFNALTSENRDVVAALLIR